MRVKTKIPIQYLLLGGFLSRGWCLWVEDPVLFSVGGLSHHLARRVSVVSSWCRSSGWAVELRFSEFYSIRKFIGIHDLLPQYGRLRTFWNMEVAVFCCYVVGTTRVAFQGMFYSFSGNDNDLVLENLFHYAGLWNGGSDCTLGRGSIGNYGNFKTVVECLW